MNVGELIAALSMMSPTMDVCIWVEDDEDDGDWKPIVQVLQEDGTTHVDLLTELVEVSTVHKSGSCGGACDLCGDETPEQSDAADEKPCADCGSRTAPRSACSHCGKVMCQICAEREGVSCCDG